MYLLDTNVVSEIRKSGAGKADPRVLEWERGVEAASLYVSIMTIFEVKIGPLRLERRDRVRAASLRK